MFTPHMRKTRPWIIFVSVSFVGVLLVGNKLFGISHFIFMSFWMYETQEENKPWCLLLLGFKNKSIKSRLWVLKIFLHAHKIISNSSPCFNEFMGDMCVNREPGKHSCWHQLQETHRHQEIYITCSLNETANSHVCAESSGLNTCY